jgi:hypothetical protein
MTMMLKDPDAALDYGVDWSTYLDAGETITNSSWVIFPAGELTASTPAHDDTSTSVHLSGGDRGKIYYVTNRVTTSLGRTDDRSFTLRIEQQ